MSTISEKMGQAKSGEANGSRAELPRRGDRFRCRHCGMEVEVTTGCKCSDPGHVQFRCCGQEMAKS
jgi:hypothetical protein